MSKSYKIPNDYNIFSALSTGKVSESVLTGLFLKRGVILSNKTSRDSKAHYFSSFMHGYDDFEKISAQYSKVDRAEYTSSVNIQTDLNVDDLASIMTNVDKALEKRFSNVQLKNVEPNLNNNVLYVEFDYEKFHPEKQMFAQIESKKTSLTFKKDEVTQQIYVEHPATPEMLNWASSILGSLKEHDEKLSIDNIDLTGLTNPSIYWEFFDELTNSFDKFKRTNVVEVLFRDPNKDENSEDEGVYQLISASYKGNQLHLSEDFTAKLEEGYLLYKFSWDCIDSTLVHSDKYRLSIKVTYDQHGKSNFSFISKGFFKNKEGKFAKNITGLPNTLDSTFNKLIFKKGIDLINSLTKTPLIVSLPKIDDDQEKDNFIEEKG